MDLRSQAGTHAQGFSRLPDAPEVLDFYAQQSPVFLAAIFDRDAALRRRQKVGDGTPVHLTISLGMPGCRCTSWVLKNSRTIRWRLTYFCSTTSNRTSRPGARNGLDLKLSAVASSRLLEDLRGDAGIGWVPHSAWLPELSVCSKVSDLQYDLTVDGTHPTQSISSGLRNAVTKTSATMQVPAGVHYALVAVLLSAPWVGLWFVFCRI